MSHDMRTPMNGLLGLTELAQDEQSVEVLQSYMSKIRDSGNYLQSLINDTLALQKLECEKMKLDYEPV